jgi:phosphohistidine phosphatase SixA
MTKYLLLMRHGKHEADRPGRPEKRKPSTEGEKDFRGFVEKRTEVLAELRGDKETSIDPKPDSSDPSKRRKLSEEGEKETREVAAKLTEVLAELQDEGDLSIHLKEVWWATTDEAAKTADVVREVLAESPYADVPYRDDQDLAPTTFKAYRNSGKHKQVATRFKTCVRESEGNDAVMVIGHQPFLSWLAFELTGEAIPIARSEIACIAFEGAGSRKWPRGRLRWVLSPSTRSSRGDLREIKDKIKSKMGIAKLLVAFITTALAFLLGSLFDEAKVVDLRKYVGAEWALRLSAVAFFIAIALFLATMYAYDRLLMPSRFWGEAPLPTNPKKRPKWLVWRPPSSELWVLYQNMMRVWRYLFTGATYAVLAGLLLLAYAVFHPAEPIVFFAGAVIGVVLFRFCYRYFGPRLGTED